MKNFIVVYINKMNMSKRGSAREVAEPQKGIAEMSDSTT